MRKGLELAREASENAAMVAEDARSAIPVRHHLPWACASRDYTYRLQGSIFESGYQRTTARSPISRFTAVAVTERVVFLSI